MQEGAIMELYQWLLGLMAVMMIISITLFFYEVSNVNSFKQHVSYQVERQGGLTDTAIKDINEYSKKYYDNRYKVESDQLNQKVSYGETVDYVVIGTYEIKLFPVDDVEIPSHGSAVSQVR